MSTTGPRVVGVDLSLTSTGVAVVERDGTASVHRLKPPKDKEGHERLRWIVDEVEDHVRRRMSLSTRTLADVVVIEALRVVRAQGSVIERAGLYWLLRDRLYSLDIPATTMEPSQLKKYATGSGNADKDAVVAAVVRRFPDVDVTGNDQADALTLAAAGRDHYGAPLVPMPVTHRVALTKIVWPVLDITPQEDPR